jgi:hypothetical protein
MEHALILDIFVQIFFFSFRKMALVLCVSFFVVCFANADRTHAKVSKEVASFFRDCPIRSIDGCGSCNVGPGDCRGNLVHSDCGLMCWPCENCGRRLNFIYDFHAECFVGEKGKTQTQVLDFFENWR